MGHVGISGWSPNPFSKPFSARSVGTGDYTRLSSYTSRTHGPVVTTTFRENWEVSPILVLAAVPLVLVAVEVTSSPAAKASFVVVQVKVASPSALVVAVVSPRKVSPSPWSVTSASALKHWMV